MTKRLHRVLVVCFVLAGLVAVRQISYAIDSRMVVADLGELFQSQAVVVGNGVHQPELLTDFDAIEQWVNVDHLNAEDLRGKVVLVNFWSYACVQCVDTLPYLKDWWTKYRRYGFELIGVHSPSYQSESHLDRVKDAVKEYGITYPVGFDSEFAIWRSYSNRVWPAMYLYDQEGKLVYAQMGTGGYAEIEAKLQEMLHVTEEEVSAEPKKEPPNTILFGHHKQDWFASPETIQKDVQAHYTFPDTLAPYQWALDGEWTIADDHAVSGSSGARLRLQTVMPDLTLALSMEDLRQTKAMVYLDGAFVPTPFAAADLVIETGSDQSSYVLMEYIDHLDVLKNLSGSHTIELVFPDPGAVIYNMQFIPSVSPAP